MRMRMKRMVIMMRRMIMMLKRMMRRRIKEAPEDTRSKKADVEANSSVRQQLVGDGIICTQKNLISEK